jgi:hypothetical protein
MNVEARVGPLEHPLGLILVEEAAADEEPEHLERLRQASEELGRAASVNELMQHLFSERAWGSMAESETYAHLEHLRLLGQAQTRWADGLLLFEVA